MRTREFKKNSFMLFSLLFIFTITLSACSSNESSSESKTNNETGSKADEGKSNTEELADKQVLNLASTTEIRSLDSAKPSDTNSVEMISRIQSGLLMYNKDMKLVPELAKDLPEANDDKTEYTFKLRDAKWSDGSPVTADQFVYAWRRAIAPDTGSEYAYFFSDAHIKNAEKILDEDSNMYGKTKKLGVKAPDDHTLKVTLSNSTSDEYFNSFMQQPVFFPLNKEFVEQQEDDYAKEPDQLLYNGPFKLKEWNHGEGWTFEKNDEYWNSNKVTLDEIHYKVVKDSNTALKLYNNDKIDYTSVDSDNIDKYKNNEEFSTHPSGNMYYWVLNYNKVPEFKNKKLRQALWFSMDRKGAVDVILNDGSLAANYLIPKDFATGPDGKDFHAKGSPADLSNYPGIDKDKGKRLWEEAKDELGINKLDIELLTTDTDINEDLSEYYVNQVTSNLDGLSMTISKLPFEAYLDKQDKGNCDICGGSGWSSDYEDPIAFLELYHSDNYYKELGFSDKKYDQILDKAADLGDQPEKRWELLQKADKYLADNAVYIGEYQKGVSVLTKPYLKDFFVKDTPIGADKFYRYAKILKH